MKSADTFAGAFEIKATMELYGVNIQTYEPIPAAFDEPTEYKKKFFHNLCPPSDCTIHLVHLDGQYGRHRRLLHYDVFKPDVQLENGLTLSLPLHVLNPT
ncbi:hypothetical protein TrRE_jg815 [Triparma retinervis]|uniref:Uncharacterized protein n=1 Tax=Triparma retinervis TaxID=2557542 RepID=A0A9W6ZZF1_9STRA|nr:hypothetical protein TrRE_jg815 [Triparma retinervis]